MILTDIANYRFTNQQLAGTKFTGAVDLIAWFGAVQAQEYAQTKWGLGLRLANTVDSDIEKAFNDGKILRTHILRPTWHFVTAEDIRWLLMLTAPRVNAANAFMYKSLALDEKVFNRCNDIMIAELQGGRHLTRDAINEAFQKNNIDAKGHRLSYIMMQAELRGLVCSGARMGNQFTYALLEERVPQTDEKNYDEALTEITKRYFLSRGPASIKDFSTWSGLTLTACKQGIEMNKPYLNTQIIENTEYYFTDRATQNDKQIKEIFLLPIYDELIMGYKDRDPIFEFKNSLKTAKLLYECMIIFEGQVIGSWKRTMKQKSMEVEFDLFKPLTKNQTKALEHALLRLEDFTNMKVNDKQRIVQPGDYLFYRKLPLFNQLGVK